MCTPFIRIIYALHKIEICFSWVYPRNLNRSKHNRLSGARLNLKRAKTNVNAGVISHRGFPLLNILSLHYNIHCPAIQVRYSFKLKLKVSNFFHVMKFIYGHVPISILLRCEISVLQKIVDKGP